MGVCCGDILPPSQGACSVTRGIRLARLLLLLLLAGAVAAVLWRLDYFDLREPGEIARAVEEVRGLPWLGPAYVLAYAAIAAVALPGAPLALIGGALVGTARGSLYVLLAAVLGAAATYALAHGAVGDTIELPGGRRVDARKLFGDGSGFLALFRLHLIPVAPFGLVNVAAALANVPFLPYIAATSLGILPGTVAYVYAGRALSAGLFETHQRAVWLAGAGCLALAALTFVPGLVRRATGRYRAADTRPEAPR